jgi:hypothetical protein
MRLITGNAQIVGLLIVLHLAGLADPLPKAGHASDPDRMGPANALVGLPVRQGLLGKASRKAAPAM